MCAPDSGHTHPPAPAGPGVFLANWRQPGPLGWKLQRLVVNLSIKVWRRQRCCGHAGEPGC